MISELDARLAMRIVGFLEYGRALELLDDLARRCTVDELEVIDGIIRDREEYTVFPLAARVPTNHRQASPSAEPEEDSDGGGRGLSWVTALARVELGAMLGGFTGHRTPYETVRPDWHDFDECLMLLVEGANAHHDQMNGDANLKRVTRSQRDIVPTLAYSRRASIARSMLGSAMRYGDAYYAPNEARQLGDWRKDLDQLHVLLLGKIQRFLNSQVSRTSETVSREFVDACGRQLAAERREMEAGTATVTNYPQ